MKLKSQFFFH